MQLAYSCLQVDVIDVTSTNQIIRMAIPEESPPRGHIRPKVTVESPDPSLIPDSPTKYWVSFLGGRMIPS